jgi:hypothetical protein
VAQVPVVMTEDRATMLRVARAQVALYGRLPFYAAMFAKAGYPVEPDGTVTDALLEHLVVWGDEPDVRRRLEASLGDGIDELALTMMPAEQPGQEEVSLSRIAAALGRA